MQIKYVNVSWNVYGNLSKMRKEKLIILCKNLVRGLFWNLKNYKKHFFSAFDFIFFLSKEMISFNYKL